VEGHGAELEAQAGDDEDDAEDQHVLVDAAGGDASKTSGISSEPVAPYIMLRP
jgi:hypothetical protein